MKRIVAFAVLAGAFSLPVHGQGITGVTVSGNMLTAHIALPGGLGGDLGLTFEDSSGLSPEAAGLSVQLVNPASPALRARLPHRVIPALPMLLRVEPPASGGLSFTGVVTLRIHTTNLLYSIGCPLRLFRAPIGGQFEDMTTGIGSGSYRARGTSGGFSEFLIVADLRSLNQAIGNKLDGLQDELDEYASEMPSSLYSDLSSRLDAVRTDAGQRSWRAAIQDLDGFLDTVEQHSGTDIPDVWNAAHDADNVAGYLRAGAMTLRFSLDLKNHPGF
jgi:Family of unknown function (DUF6689)